METYGSTLGSQAPEQLAEADLTLRQRLLGTRGGRMMVGAACALGLVGGLGVAESTATADTINQVYNTGGEGLWLHPDSPTLAGAKSEVMPDGTNFDISCWKAGDSVEGDPVWDYGTDQATGAKGFAADYYINTNITPGNEGQKLTAIGIPECDTQQPSQADTSPNLQPAASLPPFASFDRNAAAQWALNNAEDTPPNDGSCTIFVSQALWAGGMPQTSEWNFNLHPITNGNAPSMRNGSNDAWAANNFVEYMGTVPFAKVESLGPMGPNNNNVPDAKLGDVIAYDWNNDGSIDHLDIVTGFSGQYPLVSGWSEDGANALHYNQRGWTYSNVHNTWLQWEKDANGNYPNKDMQTYLIHFRNEDDLNITN